MGIILIFQNKEVSKKENYLNKVLTPCTVHNIYYFLKCFNVHACRDLYGAGNIFENVNQCLNVE